MYQLIENFIKSTKEIDNEVLNKVFFLGCSPTITGDMITYIEQIVSKYKL